MIVNMKDLGLWIMIASMTGAAVIAIYIYFRTRK